MITFTFMAETQPAKIALIKKENCQCPGLGGEELSRGPTIVNLDLDSGQADINGIKGCWQWVPSSVSLLGICGHFSSSWNSQQ